MLEELERLVDEIGALHSKLILLLGAPGTGKTALLYALAKRREAVPLSVGASLSGRLAALPQKQRPMQTSTILRELADQHAKGDLLLLDNIEILFDRTLQLDPLDILKRHGRARRVVAVWPGVWRREDERLTYAEMGHPERQDYGLEGVVPFEIK